MNIKLDTESSLTLDDTNEPLESTNVAQVLALTFRDSLPEASADPYAGCVSPEHQSAYHDDDGGGPNPTPVTRGIIVSNTHLFWQPSASFERLQQQFIIERAIMEMQARYLGYPVIKCGDFNTTPDDALYSLMTKPRPVELNEWQLNQLLPCHYDDSSDSEHLSDQEDTADKGGNECGDKQTQPDNNNNNNNNGGDSDDSRTIKRKKLEMLEHMEQRLEEQLRLDTQKVAKLVEAYQTKTTPFASAYSTYAQLVPEYKADKWDGEPKYTNYTGWKGTLDYIFVQKEQFAFTDKATGLDGWPIKITDGRLKARVRQVLSLPSTDEMEPGLPNKSFSSDHVSLMARIDLFYSKT
ncbi:RNA exonuclease ngl2 [Spiromyces aspiralis]|uniref:RNA exonuclease ngl2 n=1 Tax=Spiromyces aspiralis TaxID=68401 RepID=A0ACC1HRS8_9FUNG|nr:RNA exonuclease ngl2 [Spiromyces aspiralis]